MPARLGDVDRVHEPLTEQLADEVFPHDDPMPLYASLRAAGPLLWNATGGYWVASRHAEVTAVGADAGTFCSGKGILTFEIGVEYPSPPTMMHTDPPAHARYRALVQPAFGRRVVRSLEPTVRAAAAALVARLTTDEPVDVVRHLAAVLPVQVIGMILGLPEDDWDRVWAWSEATIPGTSTWSDETRRNELRAEMTSELVRLVAQARTGAGDPDGVIQLLATAELAGEAGDPDRLDDDELLMFLNQLLVAGNETTRNAISGGLVAFAEHPGQWERLAADRSLVDAATEEILRFTTPVIAFMRTATRATDLAGTSLVAGDPVLMLYASANRDEAEFGPDAHTFRIDRSPNHHVAFGFGPHFCLGAALARLEIAATLDALLDAGVASIAPAGAVTRSRSTIIAGVTSAPLILTRS
jgi:cytochrome P450